MPFAEHFMISGVTTAAQTATLPASININCGFLPTKIMVYDETQWGASGTGFEVIQSMFWDSSFPTQTKVTYYNAAGTALLNSAVTTNAISQYDGHNSVLLGTPVTGTTITKANPAVATATAHGFQTGQQVIITNNVVMKQLGGIIFTVTVTGANTFTIPINTNTANFTAETGFTVTPVSVGPLFYPQRTTITGITAANPMVITTATNHGLTVGQQVRLSIPSVFGMQQANFLTSVITATTATTITLGNLNSAAFTAFAWPAATAIPFTDAQVIPIGSGPAPFTFGNITYNMDVLDDATLNQQFQGFTIGAGLLQTASSSVIGIVASDVLSWTAWRGDV
jgi:hypothetical protein